MCFCTSSRSGEFIQFDLIIRSVSSPVYDSHYSVLDHIRLRKSTEAFSLTKKLNRTVFFIRNMRNSYTASSGRNEGSWQKEICPASGTNRHVCILGTHLPTTVCNSVIFVPSVLQYSPKLQFNDENEAGMEND